MQSFTKKIPHPRSIDAFAQRYGICRRTVYNQIAEGKLKTTKIGKRRIITEDQEREFLARQAG